MEDVSKTRQGGLRHRRIEPKCVRAYENRSNLSRCIVRLYQKYVSHRPSDKRCSSASFYLRPLQKPMGIVWYSCQPVGINQLAKTAQRLCTAAGLSGRRTNHSLRAAVQRLDCTPTKSTNRLYVNQQAIVHLQFGDTSAPTTIKRRQLVRLCNYLRMRVTFVWESQMPLSNAPDKSSSVSMPPVIINVNIDNARK